MAPPVRSGARREGSRPALALLPPLAPAGAGDVGSGWFPPALLSALSGALSVRAGSPSTSSPSRTCCLRLSSPPSMPCLVPALSPCLSPFSLTADNAHLRRFSSPFGKDRSTPPFLFLSVIGQTPLQSVLVGVGGWQELPNTSSKRGRHEEGPSFSMGGVSKSPQGLSFEEEWSCSGEGDMGGGVRKKRALSAKS